MNHPALARISAELVDRIRQGDDSDRRAMVRKACTLAAVRSGISDPVVVEALETIRRGSVPTEDLRNRMNVSVAALDEAAWKLEEEVERGEASQDRQLAAFAEARAATALAFALDDSLESALEALYEAYHAIDDGDGFVRTVME